MSSAYHYNKIHDQVDNNGWYQCDCCPYGYHIDLDFVRYCESMKHQPEKTGSIKKRRDRRRQRKSMEVLLGLQIDEQPWVGQLPQIPQESNNASTGINDELSEVVSDFEQTLQRSKLSTNLPDVTEVIRHPVPPVSPVISNDLNNMDSWLSPSALQNIRHQMALSLQRTKQLEDEVKQIPALQVQLDVLKEEKRNLLSHLNSLEKELKSNEPPKTRDFSGMCGVLTRTVGVGNQYPYTRTVSTNVEKLLNKYDASIQAAVATETIGVSDNTIEEIPCKKCNVKKITTASGPDPIEAKVLPISLQNLNVPRSRSFNLGEDKLNLVKNRSVSCQIKPESVNKDSQSENRNPHKSVQCDSKILANKGIQYEHIQTFTKYTDVSGLNLKKSVGLSTNLRKNTVDIGINTLPIIAQKKDLPNFDENNKEEPKKVSTSTLTLFVGENVKKEEKDFSGSKIPRPANIATTPTEVRKFKRQDTYTKIPAPPSDTEPKLAGLDLSKETGASSSFEKVKDNLILPDVSTSTAVNGLQTNYPDADVPPTHREKKVPSKEMQAACKVLNDSLKKSSNVNIKNQVKNATAIIRKEWFKVSGTVNANPLDVEDYLDYLEEVSSLLLQHIVNIMDESGNTAMHYAVSHGNFDVVSILLDSKVCNINQLNKAGYTSVMLVSLANITTPPHATVVRRLFQMADVNVRALGHGQTALMLAVSHGSLKMVTMLLEAGADINIQDEDGSTALMCAAEHGHFEIVKHFLSQPDCDSSIVDVDGSTALKIAMEAGHRDIGVLLYAHERNKSSKQKIKKNVP